MSFFFLAHPVHLMTSKCLIHNLVAVVILSNFLGMFNNHFRLKSLLSGNYNTVTCGEIKISYYDLKFIQNIGQSQCLFLDFNVRTFMLHVVCFPI